MAERTLGWIQNPSDTKTLQKIVALFNPDSSYYSFFINERIPLIQSIGRLHDEDEWNLYIESLTSGKDIPYKYLKGKGAGTSGRSNALCSGIVQAAIDSQKYMTVNISGSDETIKKPYSDDWTADGFLRWAISIGFIAYNAETDTCRITELGLRFSCADLDTDFKAILEEAYLRYPPVCRILSLLYSGNHLTKFEIGRQLGFTTEAGFTSFPQNIYLQAIIEDSAHRAEIRSNYEGSSDKYARMICRWLCEIGWVSQSPKKVTEYVGSKKYEYSLTGYTITALGRTKFKQTSGISSARKIPKIVYFQMLSTKSSDRNYLRKRRAEILDCIKGNVRTIDEIIKRLAAKGINEDASAIREDLLGFRNIGLNITESSKGIKLNDDIICLSIPKNSDVTPKSEVLLIKERVRPMLKTVDLSYLKLIDLAFDGTANREFEITTVDLLTNELGFNGKHLGGSRKPDGIVYSSDNGLIIDTKSYQRGYGMPRSQVDEMARYIRENQSRNSDTNPTCWWTEFPKNISHFFFAFISSYFTGMYKDRLREISNEYHVKGAVIDVENLLYISEGIKSRQLSRENLFALFNNDKITYP